jgi:sulfatase maturation enzyme AslB (radical SAM superfamily)
MLQPNSKTFCSSPWFHMRILPSGQLRYCRWMEDKKNPLSSNLNQDNFLDFFQKEMSSLRTKMLQGETISACDQCFRMEEHGKISGREKQLLKVGIKTNNFEKTFRSSTFYNEFKTSSEQQGDTELWPQDWQIDLGNYCNSNCVFCGPDSSSRLAAEFKKLGLIDKMPPRNWTDNESAVDRFVETLAQSKRLAYLHFLGGETVITPAFKKILSKLVDKGLNKIISIGFTTNLTVWDDEVVTLLKQYKEVNLGMSIECLHKINDYLRWPSKIDDVFKIMERWIAIGKEQKWLIQFRITPTLFSIGHIQTIYEYAYENNIGVESCNFLHNPSFMRMSVLPMDVRQQIANQLEGWISEKSIENQNKKIINTRDPNISKFYILQDASSYIEYLRNGADETSSWPALVEYLKKLESSRGNTILDYAPEYESFLRSAGY